jgi:homoserine kinase type II
LVRGTNNLVQRVETPGGSFVLRVYRNHTDPGRLRFEHDVLVHLRAAGLPFAVPAPLPTRSGDLSVRLLAQNGKALATLTPFVPGAHPRSDDLQQVVAAGEALGALDLALARLASLDAADGLSWRSYGDLEHCHPLVPDPLAALVALPVADAMRQRLMAGYAWLMEHIPPLYAALPRQLSHEDFAPDNVLMEGARITGVLDFEFCARDLRPMDLTVALSWWPGDRFGSGEEWPVLRAFACGYARHVLLDPEEIAAIPALFRLRAYTSVIHRLGRQRQGLSPLAAVVSRAHAAVAREDWLRAHSAQLVESVRAAALS